MKKAKKPSDPQKALVLEAWDRLFGPEERQEKRDRRWVAAEVNRKAKGQL